MGPAAEIVRERILILDRDPWYRADSSFEPYIRQTFASIYSRILGPAELRA